MQLTLLACLAVLCTSAFAAPAERRDDGALISAIVYVEDVLDNAEVTVAKRAEGLVDVKREDLADVLIAVTNDLNNLDVNVLTKRDDLIKAIVDVQDDLDNLKVNVLTKREDLISAIIDVQDDLDNLKVNVLTKRDDALIGVDVIVDDVLNDADINIL